MPALDEKMPCCVSSANPFTRRTLVQIQQISSFESLKRAIAGAFTLLLLCILPALGMAQGQLPTQWIYSPINFTDGITYSPDGTLLAICGQGGIQIFNVSTGKVVSCIQEPSSYTVYSLAFTKDGKTLAVGSTVLELRSVATGSVLTTFKTAEYAVLSIAFSPDGTLLAAGGFMPSGVNDDTNGVLEVWNVSSGKLAATLNTGASGQQGAVRSVQFSPDGKTLADGGVVLDAPNSRLVGVAELWNVATFKLTATLDTISKETYHSVNSVAFSPDGKTLATAGSRQSGVQYGLLELWNASSGALITDLTDSVPNTYYSCAYSSDGKTLVVGGGDVEIWDVASGTMTFGRAQTCAAVALSPDGKTLAAGGNQLELWNVKTGAQTSILNTALDYLVASVAFSPDGKSLATAGTFSNPDTGYDGGVLALWESTTGKQIAVLPTLITQNVFCVAYSPDGKLLAVSGQSYGQDSTIGVVELWNTSTQVKVATLKTGVSDSVDAVAFSPDGKTLALGGYSLNQVAELWDVPSATLIGPVSPSNYYGITSLAFSPDGKTLALGGPGSGSGSVAGTLELWNVATRSKIRSFATSTYVSITSLAFSPDGTMLADGGTTSVDSNFNYFGIVEVWNTSTGGRVATPTLSTGTGTINSVAFLPDGSALVAAGNNFQEFSTTSFGPLAYYSSYNSNGVSCLSFSATGGLYAYGTVEIGQVIVGSTSGLTAVPISGLTLSPTTVVGGAGSTGTVTLTKAAPTGGSPVRLASSLSSVVVPATVTVASGATTATFAITTQAVASNTSAVITATSGNTKATATLAVTFVSVSGISLSPTTLQGGASSTATVTLTAAAPTGGIPVGLSSNNVSAKVPSSVTVAAGATTATFIVSTTGVNSQTTVTISTGGTSSKSATLTITPAALTSIVISPSSVVGGNQSSGNVSLTGPAGPGGTTVTLSSTGASLSMPSTVTIGAGNVAATFAIGTFGGNTQTSSTVTAALGSVSKTGTLIITVATLSNVTLNPTIVSGGLSSTGTVYLNGAAGSNSVKVSLISNNAAATVPSSVVISAGQGSASFTVKTVSVPAQKVATITAKVVSHTVTASLTITPPSLYSVTLNPTAVAGGANSTGTVTLNRAAPSGGMAVKLASSIKSATVPASVTVASGKTTASFTVKSLAVSTQQTATITATLNSQSQTAKLIINAPVVASVKVNPTSVKGGKSSTGTVTISSAAPASGMSISLKSSSASATLQSLIVIAAGKTSATFTVKTTAVTTQTTATITATSGPIAKTATLTIT